MTEYVVIGELTVVRIKFAVVCCAENVSTESGTMYVWPETRSGDTATFTCPLSLGFTVTRSCSIEGEWQSFDEDACGVVSGQLSKLKDTFSNVS